MYFAGKTKNLSSICCKEQKALFVMNLNVFNLIFKTLSAR